MFDLLLAPVAVSSLQSLAQLGVAVSLAYIVAGPQVRATLAGYFFHVETLKNWIGVIEGAEKRSPGWLGRADPDGTFPHVEAVRQLLSLAGGYLETDSTRIAPQNPHTATLYAVSAGVFFAFLASFSLIPDFRIPASLAVVLALAVGIVLLYDPIRVARRALQLQPVAKAVLRVAGHFSPGPYDPGVVAEMIGAQLVVMKIISKQISPAEGVGELSAITGRLDEIRKQRKPPAQT